MFLKAISCTLLNLTLLVSCFSIESRNNLYFSSDTIHSKNDSTIEKSKLEAENLLYSHNYDSCIALCKSLLTQTPGYKPFIDIFLNAASWSQNYKLTLESSDYGLRYFPDNKDYLYARMKSLYFTGGYSECGQILNILLKSGYYNSDFEWLVPEIRKLNSKNIQVSSAIYNFRPSSDLWQFNSLGFGFRIKKVFLVPKLNISQMISDEHPFGDELFYQYEIQAFPKFNHSVYPFLSYGYSASYMQPEHKFILEVYKSLKKSRNISGGFYFFKFHDEKELYTITFSTGKYFGKFEISLKPYYTFNGGDISQSYLISAKKVLSKYDNFFSISMRLGKTPFNPYYLIEDNNKFISMEDFRIYSEFQHSFSNRLIFKLALGGGKDIYSKKIEQNYLESNISFLVYL